MMHGFALTRRRVVLMDPLAVYDLELTRLGVLRRDDPSGVIRRFNIEPCHLVVLDATDLKAVAVAVI